MSIVSRRKVATSSSISESILSLRIGEYRANAFSISRQLCKTEYGKHSSSTRDTLLDSRPEIIRERERYDTAGLPDNGIMISFLYGLCHHDTSQIRTTVSEVEQVMKVSRFKLRGLGETPESGWVDLDPKLTLIHFKNSRGSNSFLRAIETINPPYDCLTVKPFADYPLIITRNGSTRIISPRKRTIILSILDASPKLVHQLAEISPLFYETDKIEIGRRFDLSRWLNFIELPSSTRWSEVSADISSLLKNKVMPEETVEIKDYIENLLPSDRIKGPLQKSLSLWLNQSINRVPQNAQLLRTLLLKINRADYFKKARALLDKRIPLFAKIDTVSPGSNQSNSALSHLRDIYMKKIKSSHSLSRGGNQPFIEQVNHELSSVPFLQPEIRFYSARDSTRLIINHEGLTYDKVTMLSTVLQLQVISALAIVLSRIDYKSDPLLIFDLTDQTTSLEDERLLASQIKIIAGYCQCIVGTDSNNLLRHGFDGIQYQEEEITSAGVCTR